ncbi:MAG: cell division protein ZapB [Elusimicrobia bacterium]|nr:cell division protein ZapB [Elusimicrobiota bacterium]
MKNFTTLEKEISKAVDLIHDLRRENDNLRVKLKVMQESGAALEDLKKENFALQKKQEVLKLKIEKVLYKLNALKFKKDDEK